MLKALAHPFAVRGYVGKHGYLARQRRYDVVHGHYGHSGITNEEHPPDETAPAAA